MTIQQRKKILELLYERHTQSPPRILSREGLSRKMAIPWVNIQHEMDLLKEKGYVSVERTQIGTQIFEMFSITTEGIDLVEVWDDQAVLPESVPLVTGSASRISILFLTSDPTDASRLRLGEESREIQEKLQLAKLRERFTLHQRMAARPEDLSQALLDTEPQIVHFSGHGMTTGALCFEDKLGSTHPIPPDVLAALFEQFVDQVNCVILNACYAEMQANAIVEYISYVIGMNKAISDRAAIAFAIGFYQALGAGRSFEDAYKLGCVQIRLQAPSSPEYLTPVLLKRR